MSQAAVETAPVVRQSAVRRIFFGPYGLRAGWALALFLAIDAAVGEGVFWVVTHIWTIDGQGPWTPGLLIAGELAQLAIALVATLVLSRVERRDLATYGLPLRRAFGGRFWEGAAWGFGSCALAYALMAALGGYRIAGLAQHGGAALRWLGLWALAFLAVALYEEVYFRGFPLFTVSRGIGYWPAALLLSLAFGALHFFQKPNETWLDFLNVGLIGLFFCFTVRRTGDIWLATGWHFAFNFMSMGIMGSPNTGNEGGKAIAGHLLDGVFSGPEWLTGGRTGTQASACTLVTIVVLFALFAWRHREARYPQIAR